MPTEEIDQSDEKQSTVQSTYTETYTEQSEDKKNIFDLESIKQIVTQESNISPLEPLSYTHEHELEENAGASMTTETSVVQENTVEATEIDSTPQDPAFVSDDKTAYLKGKTISFIGDSITTFAGYNTEGNVTYYPAYDLQNVNQTWWQQLVEKTGAKLLTNDSYSGSCIARLNEGNLQTRLNVIDPQTDLCLVMMGANDTTVQVPLGNFDPTASQDTSTFYGGLCNAVTNLAKNYPNTKFVWITPYHFFNNIAPQISKKAKAKRVRDLNFRYSNRISRDYNNYTLIDQSAWQGKQIHQIGIITNTDANVGNVRVMLTTNPNSDDFKIIKTKDIFTMTGVWWYNVGWDVGPNEYLSIQPIKNNPLPGAFTYCEAPSQSGNFYFYNNETSSWQTSQGDLNIGISINTESVANQKPNPYTDAMIKVFDHYGIDYIDLRNLDITEENQHSYFGDGIHPNAAGAALIFEYIYNVLKDKIR